MARWFLLLPLARFCFQLRLPQLGCTVATTARDRHAPLPYRGWIWQHWQIITQPITNNQPIDENDLILAPIVFD